MQFLNLSAFLWVIAAISCSLLIQTQRLQRIPLKKQSLEHFEIHSPFFHPGQNADLNLKSNRFY